MARMTEAELKAAKAEAEAAIAKTETDHPKTELTFTVTINPAEILYRGTRMQVDYRRTFPEDPLGRAEGLAEEFVQDAVYQEIFNAANEHAAVVKLKAALKTELAAATVAGVEGMLVEQSAA